MNALRAIAIALLLSGCAAFQKPVMVETTVKTTATDGTVTETTKTEPAALISQREQNEHQKTMVDGACTGLEVKAPVIDGDLSAEGEEAAAWASALHTMGAAFASMQCSQSKAEIARATATNPYLQFEAQHQQTQIKAQRDILGFSLLAACLGRIWGFCDQDTATTVGDTYNTYVGNTRINTVSAHRGGSSGFNLFSETGSGTQPVIPNSSSDDDNSASGNNGDLTITDVNLTIGRDNVSLFKTAQHTAAGAGNANIQPLQDFLLEGSNDQNTFFGSPVCRDVFGKQNAACWQH